LCCRVSVEKMFTLMRQNMTLYVRCLSCESVNNFLLKIAIKLTITAACIVNTVRVVEGCLTCREGIVPQSLALLDSMVYVPPKDNTNCLSLIG
jgi:hypothetical protein